MKDILIPEISAEVVTDQFENASRSPRKRYPKILHKQGDYLNKVFNFIYAESYMHPHLHPSEEKNEKMYLVEGAFGLITFSNKGEIVGTTVMEKGGQEFIEVSAFTWHTYVMLTKKAIIYETMEGVYDPSTWKTMASWAPVEDSPEAMPYLDMLKKQFRGIQQ